MILMSCGNSGISSNEDSDLRFYNGKFRIAQFTDMHWASGDTGNSKTKLMVTEAVASQKPDLCILTGDIVTGGDVIEGWREVVDMMESTKKPYLILMGNHDPELMAADSIYMLIDQFGKNHIGNIGRKDINGSGNGVLTIKAANSDSVKAAIYYFDAGNHYRLNSLSTYDNIHFNQIAWYVGESNRLRSENGGKPLPSLAYFHICLPEYQQLADNSSKWFGNYGERCCPSEINSGLFSAALEQQDIMGTFVGHDHSSDFIGLWKTIALGYGRQSGAMKDDPRVPLGCRMVELSEGKRYFESWIWSQSGEEGKFYYPSGINSDMFHEHLFMKPAAISDDEVKVGIGYNYYEGSENIKSTDAMITQGTLRKIGTMDSITIDNAPAEDHFGYVFEGFFKAEKKDVYIFSVNSDDGAKLYIDDKCIVNIDGSHEMIPTDSYIALDKGYHKLRLQYFEDYMGQQLELFLTTKDRPRQKLPHNLIYVRK